MSLIKRKQNNRRLHPWYNRLSPWTNDFENILSFDSLFNDDFFDEEGLMPAMNIKEHDKDYEIEFAAPGFDKKDFEVTLEDDILQVSAEKQSEKEKKDEAYTCKEFNYNSFKRSLKLPNSVNPDQKVKASYKNGILSLNLQKKEEAKTPAKKIIEIS